MLLFDEMEAKNNLKYLINMLLSKITKFKRNYISNKARIYIKTKNIIIRETDTLKMNYYILN